MEDGLAIIIMRGRTGYLVKEVDPVLVYHNETHKVDAISSVDKVASRVKEWCRSARRELNPPPPPIQAEAREESE